jgi:polyhydroxyalkanoate synthase
MAERPGTSRKHVRDGRGTKPKAGKPLRGKPRSGKPRSGKPAGEKPRRPNPRRGKPRTAKESDPRPAQAEALEINENMLPAASPLLAFEAADAFAAVARLMTAIAKRPKPILKRMAALTDELAACLMGEKRLEPTKNDRRFLDTAWKENDYYRRLLQVYLAVAEFIRDIPECVALHKREDLARLGLNFAADGLSPTNTLMGNPVALRRAMDTGGSSLITGLRNFAVQMSSDRAHPSQVSPHAFKHGETVAATPGKVVYRDEMFELLHYAPTTPNVHDCPIVFFCSPINPYYVLDLSPGKSLFEYMISRGFVVFAISLRNPQSENVDWGLDEYAKVVIKATDAARDITGSPQVHLATACAGSVIGTLLAATLESRKDLRLRTLTSLVSMIDSADVRGGLPLADAKMAERSVARTRKRGVLQGDRVFWMFSLMRPNEAFWSYWVDNFLLGNSPQPNDLLFWANENTNIPAALLRDLLDVYVHNKAVKPGVMKVLDAGVNLADLKVDLYTLAAEKDHLMPWQSGYNSLKHFAGHRTFVLHKKGHIMALIDPPPAENSAYYIRDGNLGRDAESWRADAQVVKGSWWPHWCEWLLERSEGQHPARRLLGNSRYPTLGKAPGQYVRFKVSNP